MSRALRVVLLVLTLAAFDQFRADAFQDGLHPPQVTDIELADRATDIFIGRIEEIYCCGIANGGAVASVSAMAFD